MIGFVDLGLGKFLRSKLSSKYTIAMALPEVAEQALAAKAEHENRGIPGLVYYRDIVDKGSMPSMAQASHPGIKQGTVDKTVYHTRQINRSVEYRIKALTKHLSDRDALEKAFAFMGIYKSIVATVKDANDDEFSVKFPIFTEPCVYTYKFNGNTSEILWYEFTTRITTESYWAIGASAPRIEEVFVNYHEFATGSLIDDELLESVTITTDQDENIVIEGQ